MPVTHTPDADGAEFVRRVREPRAQSAEPGRHRARRAAMILLYRHDLVGGEIEESINAFARDHHLPLPTYSEALVRGVTAAQSTLDEQIGIHLHDWSIDRLGAVERAVLRIGMFELSNGEVPAPIVIDEAVELAKRYATPDAGKLVNGVLGGWYRANTLHKGDPTEETSE